MSSSIKTIEEYGVTKIKTPEEKITKAVIQLLTTYPFWGSLCLHLSFRESSTVSPTMGVTSYGTVYYNRRFVEALSIEELEAVICHEVLHVCLNHLGRYENRNMFRANVAADLVVNLLVSDTFKLPKGALVDERYSNMSFEQVYDALPDPKLCNNDCSKCSLAQGDGFTSPYGEVVCRRYGVWDRHITEDQLEKAKSSSKEELEKMNLPSDIKEQIKEKTKPNWRKIMNDCYKYAKTQGTLPAGLERLIGEYVEPRLSWRELLSQFITRSVAFNYSYRRPSRKSIPSGYYFPIECKGEQLEVYVVVDTSGSISDTELREFISEVVGILRQFDDVKIRFYSCDTSLSEVNEITSEYDLKATRLVGGGGTDYRPIFRKIKEEMGDTRLLVYFGDCYATFPSIEEIPPNLITIFVVSKDGNEDNIPDYFPYKVKLY